MSQNGKGSGRRGLDRASLERYEAGWELAFGRKRRVRPTRTRDRRK